MVVPGERKLVGDRRAPSRGDQQRAVIIAAVSELLETVPITDLSVLQIAKQAGVTRPAFYFYFDSKYTAVAAALERVWVDIEDATAALDSYDFSEPPAEFSDRMIGNAIEVWRANAPLLNACLAATDPQLTALWDGFVANLCARLVAFVERVRREGGIDPVTDDIPALVHTLVGMTIWVLLAEPRQGDDGFAARRMVSARAVWLSSVWGVRP